MPRRSERPGIATSKRLLALAWCLVNVSAARSEESSCLAHTDLQTCRQFTANFRPVERLAACDEGFYALLFAYQGAFTAFRLRQIADKVFSMSTPMSAGMNIPKAQSDAYSMCLDPTRFTPDAPMVLVMTAVAFDHAKAAESKLEPSAPEGDEQGRDFATKPRKVSEAAKVRSN